MRTANKNLSCGRDGYLVLMGFDISMSGHATARCAVLQSQILQSFEAAKLVRKEMLTLHVFYKLRSVYHLCSSVGRSSVNLKALTSGVHRENAQRESLSVRAVS